MSEVVRWRQWMRATARSPVSRSYREKEGVSAKERIVVVFTAGVVAFGRCVLVEELQQGVVIQGEGQ